MRSDMPKVTTERARAGMRIQAPKGEKKELQKLDWDSHPRSEKIRQKWKKNYRESKEFTDVLGPLYGYLLSKVGQPWNDVYSEICKNLKHSSLQQSHIRDHIDDFVEKHVIIINGQPCYATGMGGNYGHPIEAYRREMMYVHPHTGILCKAPKRKRYRHKPTPKKFIKIDKETILKKIQGIWYSLGIVPLAPETLYVERAVGLGKYRHKVKHFVPLYDKLLKRDFLSAAQVVEEYGQLAKAIWKKQLNKKQIKDYQSLIVLL